MAELTFRDFAGAVMQKDVGAAGRVLKELLNLDEERAMAAASHFDKQMTQVGEAFMMKAMGLRTAVTSGGDEEIRVLLGECFGLEGDVATSAVAALRVRYPR
jgi:hypothetical protein